MDFTGEMARPMPEVDLRPILVTGAHRSGTTWVGKMLALHPRLGYVSEPLNLWHRRGVLRVPVKHWYQFICNENEAEYLEAFQELLVWRYHLGCELRSLLSKKDVARMMRDVGIFLRGRLLRQRPLLKDPFAVFSALWFADRLKCRVVIVVRHPAAFASSLKRLNWPFDFGHLLGQPLLMEKWLEPFRPSMEMMRSRPEDVVGQAALLWRIIYHAVEKMCAQRADFVLVRHEDLSTAPLEGYQTLYQRLGLDFSGKIATAIRAYSADENPKELKPGSAHSVRLDSRANLENWKHRLSREEIHRIRAVTEEVAASYYNEDSWQ